MKFRCQRRCAAEFRGSQTFHHRTIAEQGTSSTAWREDCRHDGLPVTLQGEQALSRGSRPHLRGAVVGGSQHLLTVGREDCGTDKYPVTAECEQALSRGSRPHLRGAVVGGSQHLLTVGREDCGTDHIVVSQGEQAHSQSSRPHLRVPSQEAVSTCWPSAEKTADRTNCP